MVLLQHLTSAFFSSTSSSSQITASSSLFSSQCATCPLAPSSATSPSSSSSSSLSNTLNLALSSLKSPLSASSSVPLLSAGTFHSVTFPWVTYGALALSLLVGGSQGFTGLVSLCALVLLRQELLNLFFKAFYFLQKGKS
uniref:Uncharacterized protein n=1 Tax=Brassica oleracea TaxID=3712 RepID=A0A3P5ZWB9_BRAOL|nr:unnamed protein product [Brassica oleracea]